MAQSRSFLDDVKRHLECSVCQEQFSEINEPKILKCLHTFCKSCLENWLRQQRKGAALSCPNCRQITECPNNDINSLPSNLFCNRWWTFGHHVKEIGNFESSDAQDYARRTNVCKQHKDEVRFYCEQCVICICRDCAILEHRDHNIVSLDKGVEKKKSEIENKMRAVQTNGSRLRNQKESLEKQRMRVNNSFAQATEEVHRAAKRNIELIRQHEASVTEQLLKQKETFQAEFSNTVTSLDEKLMEIESSLDFGKHVLERNNLPEILNVEEVLEQRFQELLEPSEFSMKLNYFEVKYVSNDLSSLKDPPGKLFTTNTEPSFSLAEGMGLTEGTQGEDCSFTVITMDSQSKKTYSEIDRVDVDIQSLQAGTALKANITDTRDGCYKVSYKPEAAGEFNVLITVASEAIKGSPFQLKVKGQKVKRKKERKTRRINRLYASIRQRYLNNEHLNMPDPLITLVTVLFIPTCSHNNTNNTIVQSVLQQKQEFEGVALTVFELVSVELCLETVEFLTREQTSTLLKEIADKTGIMWFESSENFMMSGTFKQVEVSRIYLQQAINQSGGIAVFNGLTRKNAQKGEENESRLVTRKTRKI
ncbi:hypothetical protein OS493_005116 [Desmophyllum pertusum]|uniref:Uncharacterized protein n=1 Tax=Desmophyllum pertusum TaxID=174260 RepID=A0A9W9Z6L9_9CNID|nr:hypothetical protein OS493_005116 [Desmophyllum pertusum]